MHLFGIFCFFLVVFFNTKDTCADIQDMYYWKTPEFENQPLKDDDYIGPYPYYIRSNVDVLGSGYHAQSGLMIVTIGRLREGVPTTLNAFCTSDYPPGTSPHLWAFPDYKSNTLLPSDYSTNVHQGRKLDPEPTSDELRHKNPYNNNYYIKSDLRLISVYHASIDNKCNRLYVIDTGTMRTNDNVRYWIQKPALVVFDLPPDGCTTRKFPIIRRVELPESVWRDPLGFDYASIDHQIKGGCDDIFIYFDNIFDNSIVVYDYVKNDFWMLANHTSFLPVPDESYILDKYQLNYGVMNIALGWPDKKGNRIAYYAPGASTAEYAVTTKTLKGKRKTQSNFGSEFRLIGYHGCKGSIHRQFFDLSCGVMFFAHMASGEIACWNVGNPFNPNYLHTIIKPDPFEVFSDVYVDAEGYLWMHSCSIYIVLGSSDPLDITKVNSRLRKVRVQDAIRGTVCDTYGGLPDEIAWNYLDDQ
ncbi:L-dopachrome tautomerase yellow-f-like [Lutzomyia longipalpis]|uniref:L-dopachrome tautomerase yellow-f-like n=1 Tax=Lutzomyia longipalpis TaxID=7200 RepID=UPI0024836019|nr:L-dopachrome tautomerase yellow-f-like [Lutzomyia longipalpis]XP_055685915.1 L-dopachrome tautomerase yellow-f-like [Lutzomyia longipalpis]